MMPPLICVAVVEKDSICGERSPSPDGRDFRELMTKAKEAGWRVWRDDDFPDGDPELAIGTALCPKHRGAP